MSVDLNADVGEGFDAADDAIMPLITSANVACGGHAGDAASMERTVMLALGHGVAIGAHPGYPDREGFGRREVDLSSAALRETLDEQLAALGAVAASNGVRIGHLKPHGALYHRAATDAATADVIVDLVLRFDPRMVLVGLAASHLLAAGRAAGLTVAAEGFADRAYGADGSLRPRSHAGALHTDPEVVAEQALAIARDGRVPLAGGGWVSVEATTICLHGDSPSAVENARHIHAAFAAMGIRTTALGGAV